MVLRAIYTLFIGILLALFVGLGIAAFYEKPKQPEYLTTPPVTKPIMPGSTDSAQLQMEEQKHQEEYNKQWKAYQEKEQNYSKNVSIISLVAAIIILIISLTLFKNLLLISDGLLLGGVFTLMYSIVRGFETDNNKFRFIIVSIGLIISLILGYIKFIKPASKKLPA